MFTQFKVGTYSVAISNFKQPYGYVMLYDAAGNWRVRLNFIPLPLVNQTTDVGVSGDFIELYMNIDLLDDVVDLLRNEGPITATVNSDADLFLLGTDKEPVGQEETKLISGFVFPSLANA